MNLFVFLPLAFLFGCLALLSLVAFLGVVALAGVLHVLWAIRSALGIAGRGSVDRSQDQWCGLVGEAHPLDYIEAGSDHVPHGKAESFARSMQIL
jgi:hypothetical protein